MFDQRELTLPVERTFQNQRPGASSRRALGGAHVDRLHLRGEARGRARSAGRSPWPAWPCASGTPPARCARRSARRAPPASGPGGRLAASARSAGSGQHRQRECERRCDCAQPNRGEPCPSLCISTPICAGISPAWGDVRRPREGTAYQPELDGARFSGGSSRRRGGRAPPPARGPRATGTRSRGRRRARPRSPAGRPRTRSRAGSRSG